MRYKRIHSLERGLAVLQFLNRNGAATAGEIAEQAAMPRPTVYRILDTLAERGLVYRSPSSPNVFRLTGAVSRLSPRFEQADPLMTAVQEVLAGAATSLSWPVFFSSLLKDHVVIRETSRGDSLFWTELGWIGSAAPIWEVAAGRVFPAFGANDEAEALSSSAPANAEEEIKAIVARGYAEDRNGAGDLIGLAVPVGAGERLVGSLATVWGAGQGDEGDLIACYLPLLRQMVSDILNKAGPDTSPHESTRPAAGSERE